MYKNLMGLAKQNIALGSTTLVGQGVVGTIGGMVPGSGGAVKTIGAGLNLLNVGMLAHTGLALAKTFEPKITYKNKGKASVGNNVIKKILG